MQVPSWPAGSGGKPAAKTMERPQPQRPAQSIERPPPYKPQCALGAQLSADRDLGVGQRTWVGLVKEKELRHDADLQEALQRSDEGL